MYVRSFLELGCFDTVDANCTNVHGKLLSKMTKAIFKCVC